MDFKNKTKFFFKKLVKDRILLMTLYLIPYWDFYWFVFQIEICGLEHKCNQSVCMKMQQQKP